MAVGGELEQAAGTDCCIIRVRSSGRLRRLRRPRNRRGPRDYPSDRICTFLEIERDESYVDAIQNSHFREFHKFVVSPPPLVEGTAWSEPGTPPANPSAELDQVETSPQDPHNSYLHSDLLIKIFAGASLAEVFKAPRVCKSLREISRSSLFRETRARRYPVEPNSLAPQLYYQQDGKLYLMGYDNSDTNSWIRMPPFPCLLFSNNTKSVAGDVGLLCLFVKGPNGAGTHIAYNPLTQNQRELPPMIFPRPPCVTNLHVTVAENRYQVIAIGSQASGTHPRKTEIYDSVSKQWTDAAELPEGSLIDNQTGVCHEGYWYGTGSRELYSPKVVMVFDLENLVWLDPFDLPSRMTFPTTVQLLQCNGAIYLFSQDVSVLEITHCIFRLNPGREGENRWTKKVNDKFLKKETFSRVEYTCVPVKGKHGTQLGIFKNSCSVNAVTESVCRVYKITDDEAESTAASQSLPCPPFTSENAVLFHPENPVGYSFEPSFFVDA